MRSGGYYEEGEENGTANGITKQGRNKLDPEDNKTRNN
jgi:hypothetical protein